MSTSWQHYRKHQEITSDKNIMVKIKSLILILDPSQFINQKTKLLGPKKMLVSLRQLSDTKMQLFEDLKNYTS